MTWTPAKVSEYPSQAAEHIQNLEAQRERYIAALMNAQGGIQLAYGALERGFKDEALLHLGHHEAQIKKTLSGL